MLFLSSCSPLSHSSRTVPQQQDAASIQYPALRAANKERQLLSDPGFRPISASVDYSSEEPFYPAGSRLTNETRNAGIPDQKPAKTPPTVEELGEQWLFGPGLGKSLTNVGTSIAFPPYILYLLGNAGLELSGLPTLYATDALPERPRTFVLSFYEGITSVPGRLAALLAGRSYEEKGLDPTDAAEIVRMHIEQHD